MQSDLFQFWLSFINRSLSFSHLTLLKKSLSVTRWCWKHWWNYTNWKGAPIFLEVQGQNNLAFSEKIPSVQFSHTWICANLRPHELQHARPPCPSSTTGVHSNSRPTSWWCHPDISSSAVPFSSCPQSLPTSESFPMSQLFAWGGPSTRVSALVWFLPQKSQGWSPSEWTGWISLQSKGFTRVFSNTHSSKASILQRSAFFTAQLSHPFMTTGKTIALNRQTFFGKVMSLLLNTWDLSTHVLGQTFMIFVSKNYPWSLSPEEKHSIEDLLNSCKQLRFTWQLILQSSLRKVIKIKDTIKEVTSSTLPPS